MKIAVVEFKERGKNKRYVVSTNSIKGFGDISCPSAIDEDKMYQIKWEQSFAEEENYFDGYYPAKIVLVADSTKELQLKAKEKKMRLPSNFSIFCSPPSASDLSDEAPPKNSLKKPLRKKRACTDAPERVARKQRMLRTQEIYLESKKSKKPSPTKSPIETKTSFKRPALSPKLPPGKFTEKPKSQEKTSIGQQLSKSPGFLSEMLSLPEPPVTVASSSVQRVRNLRSDESPHVSRRKLSFGVSPIKPQVLVEKVHSEKAQSPTKTKCSPLKLNENSSSLVKPALTQHVSNISSNVLPLSKPPLILPDLKEGNRKSNPEYFVSPVKSCGSGDVDLDDTLPIDNSGKLKTKSVGHWNLNTLSSSDDSVVADEGEFVVSESESVSSGDNDPSILLEKLKSEHRFCHLKIQKLSRENKEAKETIKTLERKLEDEKLNKFKTMNTMKEEARNDLRKLKEDKEDLQEINLQLQRKLLKLENVYTSDDSIYVKKIRQEAKSEKPATLNAAVFPPLDSSYIKKMRQEAKSDESATLNAAVSHPLDSSNVKKMRPEAKSDESATLVSPSLSDFSAEDSSKKEYSDGYESTEDSISKRVKEDLRNFKPLKRSTVNGVDKVYLGSGIHLNAQAWEDKLRKAKEDSLFFKDSLQAIWGRELLKKRTAFKKAPNKKVATPKKVKLAAMLVGRLSTRNASPMEIKLTRERTHKWLTEKLYDVGRIPKPKKVKVTTD